MSKWSKSPFPMGGHFKNTWPIDNQVSGPWWGDEGQLFDASYSVHCQRKKEPLSEENFFRCDQQFQKAYLSLLQSDHESLSILPLAKKLGLYKEIKHDPSSSYTSDIFPDERFLADICEDMIPDIGTFARERVFGPYSEHPDLSKHHSILAAAILCFSPMAPHGISPAARSCQEKPKFPLPIRQSIMAMAKSPTMIWKIHNDATISPMLPLGKTFFSSKTIQNLPNSRMMIARILWSSQPTAHCVLPLPLIDTKSIFSRLWLEWLRIQRHSIHIFWEDLLRYRGELLYRSTSEYLFLTNTQQENDTCFFIS